MNKAKNIIAALILMAVCHEARTMGPNVKSKVTPPAKVPATKAPAAKKTQEKLPAQSWQGATPQVRVGTRIVAPKAGTQKKPKKTAPPIQRKPAIKAKPNVSGHTMGFPSGPQSEFGGANVDAYEADEELMEDEEETAE